MDEALQLRLEALIDYIVNTPNNFNPNLFREYFTNPMATNMLIKNYLKKIEIPSANDSAVPSDSSDIPILEPPSPSSDIVA